MTRPSLMAKAQRTIKLPRVETSLAIQLRTAQLVFEEGLTAVDAAKFPKMNASTLHKQLQVQRRLRELGISAFPPSGPAALAVHQELKTFGVASPGPIAQAVSRHLDMTRGDKEYSLFSSDKTLEKTCLLELFQLLESAKTSMDIAIYCIRSHEIAHYLIEAKKRKLKSE